MHFARITPGEIAGFRDLVNAEIRPDRAKTNAWDDFPLILAPENQDSMQVARTDDGIMAAGLACLIRDFRTSCGQIPVAGIGSVVTKPEFRGQGLSSTLQDAMLSRLRRQNVPLAVLWTDQPEIYAGRGFTPAGWEFHVDLKRAQLPSAVPEGLVIRNYQESDAGQVGSLYGQHRYGTCRQPGDDVQLYGMPGTSGLVLAGAETSQVFAAVFCGKGADFPDYVAEWDGPVELVITLLGEACRRGIAHHVLCPAGTEDLVDALSRLGAGWLAQPSGLWVVLDSDSLSRACGLEPGEAPAEGQAAQWLGAVDDAGELRRGLVDLAVWGFDSV